MRYGGIVILGTCAVVLALLKLFEPQLTYPLDPTPITPAEAGVQMTDIRMIAEDGTKIVLWLSPPRPGQPLVLYFPGNAGNLGHRARRFDILIRNGIGVLAMAYRGSNGSGGAPSEPALRGDARQMADLAAARFPEVPILYYGESLGTGVAADLALTRPPSRMVLEAPYTSIPDAALQTEAPDWVRPFFANHWDTKTAIAAYTGPLLVLHGTQDRVIPVDQGQAVFEAAASPQKRFERLDGLGHHDLWQPEVQSRLIAFLKG